LTVDIFLAVDGWAGSDGLPGYFGYLGPEIEEAGCSSWSTDRLGKTFHEPEPEHWQAARAR
jgi:hypothetical protein